MRYLALLGRNLQWYWRRHLPVALGVATGTATLVGALLVGDSMRSSLRRQALERLGRVQAALVGTRFVGENLVERLNSDSALTSMEVETVGAIFTPGGATHATTRLRAGNVSLWGIDDSFWPTLGGGASAEGPAHSRAPADGHGVLLNEPLARELGAAVGDDVVLRIPAQARVSPDTLFGKRDDNQVTLRLTVRGVVPGEGTGSFSLRPRQGAVRCAFVSLPVLQRALGQRGRVNRVLLSAAKNQELPERLALSEWQEALRRNWRFEDVGLRLRAAETTGQWSLESDRLLLEPVVESAALDAAADMGVEATPVLTYLANRIERVIEAEPSPASSAVSESRRGADSDEARRTVVPYSTVAAIDPHGVLARSLVSVDVHAPPLLRAGGALIHAWTQERLQAHVGDTLRMEYYLTAPNGTLSTRSATFDLLGVVAMEGAATDRNLAPTFEGITDARSMTDWDAPFPIDLGLIEEADERYWERYRAAPKLFVTLEDGRHLWQDEIERFGTATSIRLAVSAESNIQAFPSEFEQKLMERLSPDRVGLPWVNVRAEAISASAGSTDFGMLFLGFSLFLIASSLILVALLFRLAVERRAVEVGTLSAVGLPGRSIRGLLLAEGAVVSGAGALAGLLLAILYGEWMLLGLTTWWSKAANAPFLRLEIRLSTLLAGYTCSVTLGLLVIWWSLGGMFRRPVRWLLAGLTSEALSPERSGRPTMPWIVNGLLVASAAGLSILGAGRESTRQALMFFASGALLLAAGLLSARLMLTRRPRRGIGTESRWALLHLGVGNAARHPGRSVLTIGLLASATFLVVSIQAFRVEPLERDDDRTSSTGGFALLAESAVPIVHDLGSEEGWQRLGLSGKVPSDVRIFPLRLRPGEETGCLNLYAPGQPRLLGAGEAFLERGGFRFAASLADTPEEKSNPWLLLRRPVVDGAIPVIGDESAVRWQLHSGLGQELVVNDERGESVRLRFVALLAGSALQDELILAERDFLRLFPSLHGYSFFLIESSSSQRQSVAATLESQLEAFAFDAVETRERLASFLAVQNTYLSTFQTLGGLGLVLGTLGLAVVLLRNVWERRSELAVMRAVGFSRRALGWLVLSENAALVLAGLVLGAVPAMVAIAPHLAARAQGTNLWGLLWVLVGVLFAGAVGGLAALRLALRTPLIPALRRE